MSNPLVKQLQQALGVTDDGDYGPKTHEAVMKRLGPVQAPATVPQAPKLDARSEARLIGVDEGLANVVRRAAQLSTAPFMVIEGVRTKERQQELYAQGRTKPGKIVTWTMKSKHIEGKAVDLAPVVNGNIDWNDLSKFDAIYRAMMKAASEVQISIRYGGDWDGDGKLREKGEGDSPHFERP